MIEHYLDGTQVFPAAGEKIQITSENAILTKSGSYTLEVKFPLSIYENREFFGDLNRIDITKNVQTWEVKVINNGVIMMLGTATLIKVTDKEVSVQYVAGNSQVNFWENADKTYIDEYDYNTMEDGRDRVEVWEKDKDKHYIQGWGYPGEGLPGPAAPIKNRKMYDGLRFVYDSGRPPKYDNFFYGEEGVFCFANVYDEDFDWEEEDPSKNRDGVSIGNGVTNGFIGAYGSRKYYGMAMYANCIQPNLLWIIEQVVAKRGYTIDRNDIKHWGFVWNQVYALQGYYARKLYIASARLTLKIADALPHWTVKEFFSHVEEFFNCTIIFNEEEKKCSFVLNNTILEAEKCKIEEVVDEHEEEVGSEDSSEANIFGSNIKYKDIGKEKERRCDDSTRKKYSTVWGDSYDELRNKAVTGNKSVWKFFRDRSKKGLTYGWDGNNLIPIDYLCNQYRGSEEDFELKIVPARIETKYYNLGDFDVTGQERYRYPLIKMAVLTMKNSWKGYKNADGTLIQEILGEAQGTGEGQKEDFLPVFFYEGHKMSSSDRKAHHSIYYSSDAARGEIVQGITEELCGIAVPVADLYTGKYWNCNFELNERKPYSLALVPGHTEIYQGQLFEGNPKINMQSELHISFRSITPPNPRAVFYIHNKKYLCSKIEYEIDENGIIPLMKGYFHEVVED